MGFLSDTVIVFVSQVGVVCILFFTVRRHASNLNVSFVHLRFASLPAVGFFSSNNCSGTMKSETCPFS